MMNNLVTMPSRKQSQRLLNKNGKSIGQSDIRQTVNDAIAKLEEVSARVEKIENKGFFKRLWGGFTGSNNREMVASLKDLAQAQQITIQLVLSLAVMHSQNQQTLEEILSELDNCRGIYTRSAEHIDFLYSQIEYFKDQQRMFGSSANYYNRIFQKFSANNDGFTFTWNWAAFFGGPFWYMAKGLWGRGIALLSLYFVSLGLLIIPGMIIAGITGNYAYFKKIVNNDVDAYTG
ncbi:MAG: hypothetical protein ABFD18_06060 [Syntrophomonas sp.]